MGATLSTAAAAQPAVAEQPLPGSGQQPLQPALRYDPEELARQYRGRWGLVLGRLFQLIAPFLGLLIWVLWDRWRGVELKNRRKHAARLREILTELGPTAIKIGQALSTRPDLVSPLFLEELAKLQDELPPFDNATAFALIEAQIGQPIEQIFREIGPEPVAAASLGQVYQAYLHRGESRRQGAAARFDRAHFPGHVHHPQPSRLGQAHLPPHPQRLGGHCR